MEKMKSTYEADLTEQRKLWEEETKKALEAQKIALDKAHAEETALLKSQRNFSVRRYREWMQESA